MRVLLAGGARFIGSSVAKEMALKGTEVVVPGLCLCSFTFFCF
jgi:UDP-glucose 4-epimerase